VPVGVGTKTVVIAAGGEDDPGGLTRPSNATVPFEIRVVDLGNVWKLSTPDRARPRVDRPVAGLRYASQNLPVMLQAAPQLLPAVSQDAGGAHAG
jgi:hypothetical protein